MGESGAAQSKFTNAVEQLPSGVFLPSNAVRSARRVVVDATAFSDAQIKDLVDSFAELQLLHPYFKPIFLISAMHPEALLRSEYLFETVVQESSWPLSRQAGQYQDHVERRLIEMMHVYRTDRAGTIRPGENVPRWLYER